MKLKFGTFALVFLGRLSLFAQDQTAHQYGNMITPNDLKEYLSILASDALEGRETGKRGQKMAAAFISAHFQEIGLSGPVAGSFYQPVELYTSIPGEIYVKSGQNQYANFQEIIYYGSADSGGEVSVPVVFAGKGKAEDFDQLNVEGKGVAIAVGSDENFRASAELAQSKGAKMVFIFNPDAAAFKELANQFKGYLSGGRLSLTKPGTTTSKPGVFFLSPAVIEKTFGTTIDKLTKASDAKKGSLKKIKPGNITYKTSMDVRVLRSENVLGYLEGTDKKDELVVVTSHYDHIGMRDGNETGDRINNGADDDGSGTVTVMELAKIFAQAKKDGKGPRRSMLFMTVTGEEKGLLGSDYYTQHPVFPLANTVVDLNIDMVGRRDAQHKDSAAYVYVIGSDKLSTELHTLSESINKKTTNLVFDYTYNDQNHPDRLYYRSDHWNFAKNNVPIIFYFDGIHEDYHRPSDEVEKIEFDLLTKRAQCVFFTAWEIANREQRIMPDKK